MSRMIHNADISYSSINNSATAGAGGGNFRESRANACCRSCFLNFPYATITSTFLVISGLTISIISTYHLLGILDRMAQDLFYKHFPLSDELKVVLLFIISFIAVVVLVNLIIGFATSFLRFDGKPNQKMCFCFRNSTTNCLIRFVFLVNQIIFIAFFMLFLTFTLLSFTLYILKTLCNSIQMASDLEKTFDTNTSSSQTNREHCQHSIDLRPFASIVQFKSNETELLLFKENRLKTICRDYISPLILYNLISFLGVTLLFIGFYCYSINLTVNRIRIATYRKYTELLYLSNCTEMNAFNDVSFEGERF